MLNFTNFEQNRRIERRRTQKISAKPLRVSYIIGRFSPRKSRGKPMPDRRREVRQADAGGCDEMAHRVRRDGTPGATRWHTIINIIINFIINFIYNARVRAERRIIKKFFLLIKPQKKSRPRGSALLFYSIVSAHFCICKRYLLSMPSVPSLDLSFELDPPSPPFPPRPS